MKSTNPRMAMMLGRAKKRPALAVNPAQAVAPTMGASLPTMKKGGNVNKLFKGKETYAEELKEAKALKSGKISAKQFVKGEKSEGHKGEEPNPSKLAKEIKSGRKSPQRYAKEEAKEMKMKYGGRCMSAGGYTRSADGIAKKGKTKGKII